MKVRTAPSSHKRSSHAAPACSSSYRTRARAAHSDHDPIAACTAPQAWLELIYSTTRAAARISTASPLLSHRPSPALLPPSPQPSPSHPPPRRRLKLLTVASYCRHRLSLHSHHTSPPPRAADAPPPPPPRFAAAATRRHQPLPLTAAPSPAAHIGLFDPIFFTLKKKSVV